MKKKCKYIGRKRLAPELHYQLKYSFPTFRYFYEVICKNLIEAQVAVFSFIYWSNALIARAHNLICSSEARTLSKNNIVTFFWGYQSITMFQTDIFFLILASQFFLKILVLLRFQISVQVHSLCSYFPFINIINGRANYFFMFLFFCP
jgi:hypothetical protein